MRHDVRVVGLHTSILIPSDNPYLLVDIQFIKSGNSTGSVGNNALDDFNHSEFENNGSDNEACHVPRRYYRQRSQLQDLNVVTSNPTTSTRLYNGFQRLNRFSIHRLA